MDEKQQIQKVLKGDTSAFAHFVDTYQAMAITIAYRICGNREDAEDIVQNAFVKAYHNLHAFRLHSKFSTWFYRIVYNTGLTYIDNREFNTEFVDYNQVDAESSYSEWDAMGKLEVNERKRIINEAMDKMPKDEGLLLSLYYLEENSVKDICLIVGLSEANVKVKLFRARKRLAEILTKMMNYEKF